MNSPPVLELLRLSIGTSDKPILNGINLQVASGETTAIVGTSGLGKTTLLRTIAGLINPISGSIRLEGRTPEEIGWPVYRRRVVLMEQQSVFKDMSVQENLQLPFKYRSAMGEKFPLKEAQELLEILHLNRDILRRNVRQLSVGQQQRVALIRALLLRPKAALLDEPTSALDDDSADLVCNLVARLALERGFAIIAVTHDKEQARGWCGNIIDIQQWSLNQAELQVRR